MDEAALRKIHLTEVNVLAFTFKFLIMLIKMSYASVVVYKSLLFSILLEKLSIFEEGLSRVFIKEKKDWQKKRKKLQCSYFKKKGFSFDHYFLQMMPYLLNKIFYKPGIRKGHDTEEQFYEVKSKIKIF